MRTFANAFSVPMLSLGPTQGCANPGLKLANAFGVPVNQDASIHCQQDKHQSLQSAATVSVNDLSAARHFVLTICKASAAALHDSRH